MSRVLCSFILVSAVCVGACAHKKKEEPKVASAGDLGSGSGAAVAAPAAADTSSSSHEDSGLQDAVYFDFEDANLDSRARDALSTVAKHLRAHPSQQLRIEGHCDERGTTEYNLALGDQRARSAKKYLVSSGVASKKISTVTYGKERPRNPGHSESAWAENRRDDLVLK